MLHVSLYPDSIDKVIAIDIVKPLTLKSDQTTFVAGNWPTATVM